MSLAQSPYVKKGLDFNNKRNFVKDWIIIFYMQKFK